LFAKQAPQIKHRLDRRHWPSVLLGSHFIAQPGCKIDRPAYIWNSSLQNKHSKNRGHHLRAARNSTDENRPPGAPMKPGVVLFHPSAPSLTFASRCAAEFYKPLVFPTLPGPVNELFFSCDGKFFHPATPGSAGNQVLHSFCPPSRPHENPPPLFYLPLFAPFSLLFGALPPKPRFFFSKVSSTKTIHLSFSF